MHIMFARPQSKDASVTQATRAEKAKYFQLLTYRFLFFKMEESQELKWRKMPGFTDFKESKLQVKWT